MSDTDEQQETFAPNPKLPITAQMQQITAYLGHRLREIERLKRRIDELEAPTPEETAQEKAEREREDRQQRRRDREEARAEAAAAELQRARAAAIRAIAKLLPEAIRQAKAKPPRPALLRLILRATR